MTNTQRSEALRYRKQAKQPWHAPPHGMEKHWYHISAACFEHKPYIGLHAERIARFESDLLAALAPVCEAVSAWCVLPNHYHVLVQSISLPNCRKGLGRLHGRSSYLWNREDEKQGRQCWHSCLPKAVKSERHRWATLNYIHNNAVHHGYVAQWQEWPFSSATNFIQYMGRERVEEVWRKYPVLDMGEGWDDASL